MNSPHSKKRRQGHSGQHIDHMRSSTAGAGDAISAPYNFVPLANWVFMPGWAPQVSHDVPLEDGISGALDITLTAHTPILCADEPVAASRHSVAEAHFVKSGQQYLIPGSTLKGTVRNVVEILSFGRMRAVDEQRFALRDISSSKKIAYADAIRGKVRTGFLEKTEDGPRLIPCEYVWLPHTELQTYLGLAARAPLHKMFNSQEHKGVSRKISRWRELCRTAGKSPDSIQFEIGEKKSRRIAQSLGQGGLRGVPVFTGQVSDDDARSGGDRKFKKHDFVFFNAAEDKATPLAKREWRDFLFVQGDAETKDAENMSWPGYWRQCYFEGERVPVFYVKRDWGKAIGLAYMPRLAGDWSTHELVRAISPSHLEMPRNPGAAEYDLAELMFGTLGESQPAALASRVMFEPAFAQGNPKPVANRPPTVLNGPKPSYFPNYLVQNRLPGQYATYVDLDRSGRPPTLRGRKRYPVRSQIEEAPLPSTDNMAVSVKLFPLPEGTQFKSRVVFHNLKPEELGALIWGLTLGDSTTFRHALGMGKPFGYGQLSVRIDSASLDPLDGRASQAPEQYCTMFADMMEAQCAERKVPGGWRESDAIRLFMAMSDPDLAEPAGQGGLRSGFPGQLAHMPLNPGKLDAFTRAKQDGLSLQPYLSGVVLDDVARAQNVAEAGSRPRAVSAAPVVAPPEPASPPPRLRGLAQLTYNPGRGTLEISATIDKKPIRIELNRAETEAVRNAHAEWWQRVSKKRRGSAYIAIDQVGAHMYRHVLEEFMPE